MRKNMNKNNKTLVENILLYKQLGLGLKIIKKHTQIKNM